MPTKHRRINVPRDEALAEALARVRDLVTTRAESALVHAMALKGVEATLAERDRRAELVAELIAHITADDWPPLSEEIDRGAWGIGTKLPGPS